MAGHMGAAGVTVQNLEVVGTDSERGLIFVKGAVPGSKGGYVRIIDSVKRKLPEEVPFPAAVLADLDAKTAKAETQVSEESTLSNKSSVSEADTSANKIEDSPHED